VEDTIDRLPAHEDPEAAVSALDDLKGHLNLVDGVSGWGFSGARVDARCEAWGISGSDRIGRGGIYVVTRDVEGFSSCV
jgi:hypothetical protein